MSNKNLLTKVMSGVALGGAALLMSTPAATAAANFDNFGFKDHGKFKETGYISGIAFLAPLDIVELETTIRITQVCSKPQSAQPFAKVLVQNEDTEIIPVPLELEFPGLDALYSELFSKHGFDGYGGAYDGGEESHHGKKFHHEDKNDHGKEFHDDKFDGHKGHHGKKDDLFFVYEGTVTVTDLDILDLLNDGSPLVVKGTCATGTVDVVEPDLLDVANGV